MYVCGGRFKTVKKKLYQAWGGKISFGVGHSKYWGIKRKTVTRLKNKTDIATILTMFKHLKIINKNLCEYLYLSLLN